MQTTTDIDYTLFSRAADYLDENGWYQGGLMSREDVRRLQKLFKNEHPDALFPDGVDLCVLAVQKSPVPMCAAGAIQGIFRPYGEPAVQRAFSVINTHLDESTNGVGTWNDMPQRTVDDVTSLFRSIAAQADQ